MSNLSLNDKEYRKFRETPSGQAIVVVVAEVAPTDPNQLNPSLTISNPDMTVASTKTITKTIGSVSYTKTISYNVSGEVVSISAWSEL